MRATGEHNSAVGQQGRQELLFEAAPSQSAPKETRIHDSWGSSAAAVNDIGGGTRAVRQVWAR